jgi:hypothetical protein
LHDGISFEQSGKAALVICTTPFESPAKNIARVMGLPDYQFAMVEHPLGSRTLAEIKVLARSAYEQGLEILS